MLAETGSVAASVTAYAVADVMLYGDPNAPVQSGTATTSVPLNIAANLSGYTSTSENSITAMRIFDPQTVEPIGGYWKQFPLGREPLIKPGNVCRIMVKGDNTTKCVCYLVFEV
jgi:hypothetical protein